MSSRVVPSRAVSSRAVSSRAVPSLVLCPPVLCGFLCFTIVYRIVQTYFNPFFHSTFVFVVECRQSDVMLHLFVSRQLDVMLPDPSVASRMLRFLFVASRMSCFPPVAI